MISQSFHPKVSVVIPTRNNGHYLRRCLESVFQTDYPDFEVIIVDDCSTDNTQKVLENFVRDNPYMVVIRNRTNLGHTESLNVGVKFSRGHLIAKLDEDTIVDPSWLIKLVETLTGDPTIGIVQSAAFEYWESNLVPDFCAGFLDYWGRAHYERARGSREVFHAIMFASLMSRELYRKIGGFYSDSFIYYEETDLCWRLRLKGYRAMVVGDSIVRHLGASRLASPHDQKANRPKFLFHAIKNSVSSLIINYEFRNVMKYLPPSIGLRADEAVFSLLFRRDSSQIVEFARAMVWILRNMRSIMARRVFVNRLLRVVPDDVIKRVMVKPRVRIHKQLAIRA